MAGCCGGIVASSTPPGMSIFVTHARQKRRQPGRDCEKDECSHGPVAIMYKRRTAQLQAQREDYEHERASHGDRLGSYASNREHQKEAEVYRKATAANKEALATQLLRVDESFEPSCCPWIRVRAVDVWEDGARGGHVDEGREAVW